MFQDMVEPFWNQICDDLVLFDFIIFVDGMQLTKRERHPLKIFNHPKRAATPAYTAPGSDHVLLRMGHSSC